MKVVAKPFVDVWRRVSIGLLPPAGGGANVDPNGP